VHAHPLGGPGGPVGPVGAQRIVHVRHGEDARGQRDLLSLQATRVARAVPLLVVAVGDVQRGPQVEHRGQQVIRRRGVAAHDHPLLLRERPRLEQDGVGHAHLADVVQQGAPAHLRQLLPRHAQGLGQPER